MIKNLDLRDVRAALDELLRLVRKLEEDKKALEDRVSALENQ